MGFILSGYFFVYWRWGVLSLSAFANDSKHIRESLGARCYDAIHGEGEIDEADLWDCLNKLETIPLVVLTPTRRA